MTTDLTAASERDRERLLDGPVPDAGANITLGTVPRGFVRQARLERLHALNRNNVLGSYS